MEQKLELKLIKLRKRKARNRIVIISNYAINIDRCYQLWGKLVAPFLFAIMITKCYLVIICTKSS